MNNILSVLYEEWKIVILRKLKIMKIFLKINMNLRILTVFIN